jgi:NodT family efflux transporter outer membrane factor (OMF) lipoprotein
LLGEQPGTVHGIIGDGGNIPWTSKQLVLSAPAVVIDNRPDIHMAERKLASATAQQGVATAQFYPDISLNGFLGLLNTHSSDLLKSASKSWIMGASVAWPILSYGKLEANQEGADAAQQEALATYQKSIIAALVDVEKSVTAYTQQEKFRTALASSVEKNHQATKVSEQRYSQGVTPFLDVLDAQRTYYSSELQLAQARADTARNLIAVYKSLGGGWTPRGTPDTQPESK